MRLGLFFPVLVFTIVLFLDFTTANLHCFTCTNITEGTDCNTVSECRTGQDCFVERTGSGGNDTSYTLGCIDTKQCPAVHPFEIVGRSVSDHCMKCCHETGCNKKFCEVQVVPDPVTTVGSCIDAPGQNCSRMAALFSVCSDPHHAKDVCRKYCGLCDLVDGGWNLWEGWSPCSTSCGLGIETRGRQCNNPSPSHGGSNCSGQSTQQRSCYTLQCPTHGGWSSWNSWESCSTPCGPGLRKRHRTCSNPQPSALGHYCIGDSVDFSLCNGTDCRTHASLATATPSVITCSDALLGSGCDMMNRTIGLCGNRTLARQTCPKFCNLCGIVDGKWSNWGLWTSCSVSCDDGLTTRARSCTNPAPLNGGTVCSGKSSESKTCLVRDCPVHGSWGTWGDWNSCSSTCGPGITHRIRACDSPRPSLLGNNCFGDSSDYGMCMVKPCPVNGHWTEWMMWSGCSATCGSGNKTRMRYCLNPAPANGGSACTGSNTDRESCGVTICPVNGQWSSWSSWSPCINKYGLGYSQKTRTCSNPTPSSLGRGCVGDSTVQRLCTIRLVNGTQKSGRVEILYDFIWGTICDDDWDDNDAKVVCRMLGYRGGTAYGNNQAHFGQGTGRITLDHVTCTGSESTIFDCGHSAWLYHVCSHSEDAGVSCT